ncbi:MAG TPA: hypothetical protein VL309_03280, partial [Vicinamibacterales bacterium]|nr:hypothetical protein [Vicinamibacterales bacterium]
MAKRILACLALLSSAGLGGAVLAGATARQAPPPAGPAARSAPGGQSFVIRCLAMAVAALLTANGVIVAEQVTGRDLITLSTDGMSNAREAIARLLGDNKDKSPVVAGVVVEKPTTTTTAAPAGEDSTTTSAPAAAVPAPAAPA